MDIIRRVNELFLDGYNLSNLSRANIEVKKTVVKLDMLIFLKSFCEFNQKLFNSDPVENTFGLFLESYVDGMDPSEVVY